MLNIGHGGSLIVADRRLKLDQHVWVRMEHPASTHWTTAKVVRTGWSRTAGLRFIESCPNELFRAATYGDRLDTKSDDTTAVEYDSLWR